MLETTLNGVQQGPGKEPSSQQRFPVDDLMYLQQMSMSRREDSIFLPDELLNHLRTLGCVRKIHFYLTFGFPWPGHKNYSGKWGRGGGQRQSTRNQLRMTSKCETGLELHLLNWNTLDDDALFHQFGSTRSSTAASQQSWYQIQFMWNLGLFFIQSTDNKKVQFVSRQWTRLTAKQQLDDNVWSHHVPATAVIAAAVAAALLQLMMLLLCCCFFYCCEWYCCSCCCCCSCCFCRLCCCCYRCWCYCCYCCYCCCCRCSCCHCWSWSGQAAAVKRWIHLRSTHSK